MELKFIEKGAALDIQVNVHNMPMNTKYAAKFYELCGASSFLVESQELYKEFSSFTNDTYLDICLFHAANMFSLKGKPRDAFIQDGLYLIQIDQVSTLEVYSRRMFPRHELSVPVNIYAAESDDLDTLRQPRNTYDAIFSGKTFDLSVGGLCILSNEKIVQKEDRIFIIELTMNKNERFVLPAKLVRSGNASQSVQYKFDYGFLFDFKNQEHEKARLVTSIFKLKLTGV